MDEGNGKRNTAYLLWLLTCFEAVMITICWPRSWPIFVVNLALSVLITFDLIINKET